MAASASTATGTSSGQRRIASAPAAWPGRTRRRTARPSRPGARAAGSRAGWCPARGPGARRRPSPRRPSRGWRARPWRRGRSRPPPPPSRAAATAGTRPASRSEKRTVSIVPGGPGVVDPGAVGSERALGRRAAVQARCAATTARLLQPVGGVGVAADHAVARRPPTARRCPPRRGRRAGWPARPARRCRRPRAPSAVASTTLPARRTASNSALSSAGSGGLGELHVVDHRPRARAREPVDGAGVQPPGEGQQRAQLLQALAVDGHQHDVLRLGLVAAQLEAQVHRVQLGRVQRRRAPAARRRAPRTAAGHHHQPQPRPAALPGHGAQPKPHRSV